MKTFHITVAIISVLTFFACESNNQSPQEIEVKVATPHAMNMAEKLDVAVVNQLDPICQMKTADHLSDTITYKGHLYGFCSSGCKQTFSKNPENYIHD